MSSQKTLSLLRVVFALLLGLTIVRMAQPPQLASAQLLDLTTVTDVMGFFTFLGLATLLLLH